jgi:hypothetical protein
MNSSSMPSDLPPPAPRGFRPGRSTWTVVAVVLAGAIALGGLVIFTAGEDLFGSDDGSIDSYNREVPESCDVPYDWTLVRTYIFPDVNSKGDPVRTMSYVWASPQTSDEVAAYYGIDGPGVWTLAPVPGPASSVSDHRCWRLDSGRQTMASRSIAQHRPQAFPPALMTTSGPDQARKSRTLPRCLPVLTRLSVYGWANALWRASSGADLPPGRRC